MSSAYVKYYVIIIFINFEHAQTNNVYLIII